MPTYTMNEYRVVKTDNSVSNVVAESMLKAVEQVDSTALPAVMVTREKVGLSVTIPQVTKVTFSVVVDPDGASVAGCIATPTTFTVDSGTTVIFQAIPAPGYTFSGWYKGETLLSANQTASLLIESLESTYEITARFTAT